MKKNKSLLGLYLIVSLVLIVCSIVLALTIGINFGTDIAGGSQIEVQILDNSKVDEQIERVEQALKDNNLKAEKIFVEDKGIVSNIVVRINKHDIKNADQIRQDICLKTGNDITEISAIQEFSGMVTNKSLIWISVSAVAILLALFIFGLLRYTIVGGISLMFTVMHALIASLALLIVTRLPISFVSLIAVLLVVAVVIFAMVLTLEKLRDYLKQKHNQNAEIEELVTQAKKEILKPVVALAVVLLLTALVFVFVPVRFVRLSALALLVSTIVGVFSFYFVGILMYQNLYKTKKMSEKAKLSKNVSPKKAK